ncbi:MAG TPA: glycosyltransferase [Candidatus Pacearchaeota archaeon]|nr:glycosyltransferase [Candidatus Pacearchaeota archaeon]
MIRQSGKRVKKYSNKKDMLLSIVVPTLNEEANIERLLGIVKRNSFNDYEIIVADAGSKDRTCEIAKKYGARVVPGGLPAKGKNEGAKVSKGEILLFLDADLEMSEGFLDESIKEFITRRLDIASYRIYPQISNMLMNRMTLDIFYNYPAKILKKFFPTGAMGIMVRKEKFDAVGGFDEKIKLAEDHYMVWQVAKIGSYGIFKNGEIYMPLRRFEKDGYARTLIKYLQCGIRMKTKGPDRDGDFEYDFDHYDQEVEGEKNKFFHTK